MPLVLNTREKSPTKKEATNYMGYPNFGYRHHVTVVLSLQSLRYFYLNSFSDISKQYMIRLDEEEDLYDWLVTEALQRVLQLIYRASVGAHYRHDIYKNVYDSIGAEFQYHVKHQILHVHRLSFLQGQKVKILVAGDTLFITKGVNPSV